MSLHVGIVTLQLLRDLAWSPLRHRVTDTRPGAGLPRTPQSQVHALPFLAAGEAWRQRWSPLDSVSNATPTPASTPRPILGSARVPSALSTPVLRLSPASGKACSILSPWTRFHTDGQQSIALHLFRLPSSCHFRASSEAQSLPAPPPPPAGS